jgi:hypothetical protein
MFSVPTLVRLLNPVSAVRLVLPEIMRPEVTDCNPLSGLRSTMSLVSKAGGRINSEPGNVVHPGGKALISAWLVRYVDRFSS